MLLGSPAGSPLRRACNVTLEMKAGDRGSRPRMQRGHQWITGRQRYRLQTYERKLLFFPLLFTFTFSLVAFEFTEAAPIVLLM